MTLPAKPRGKSAGKYAELHAEVKGELDALRYATNLRNARVMDVVVELMHHLEQLRNLLERDPR